MMSSRNNIHRNRWPVPRAPLVDLFGQRRNFLFQGFLNEALRNLKRFLSTWYYLNVYFFFPYPFLLLPFVSLLPFQGLHSSSSFFSFYSILFPYYLYFYYVSFVSYSYCYLFLFSSWLMSPHFYDFVRFLQYFNIFLTTFAFIQFYLI